MSTTDDAMNAIITEWYILTAESEFVDTEEVKVIA